MAKKNTGKEYEKIVAAIHRQFNDTAIIKENEKIIGKSGKERQIDVSIRSQVIGYDILIIIQAKDYNRYKVDIEKVDSLIGTLQDVNASKGILVSNSGFSDGAVKRAKQDGRIDLVSVVDVENNKIRTKVGIPTLVNAISVQSFSIQIKETSAIESYFTQQDLSEAKLKFIKLWNEGKLDINTGEHEYVDNQVVSIQQKREIIYQYTVTKKSYFKNIGLEKGSGILNVSNNSFKTKSMTTQAIQIQDIFTTWEELSDKDDKKWTLKLDLVSTLPEAVYLT